MTETGTARDVELLLAGAEPVVHRRSRRRSTVSPAELRLHGARPRLRREARLQRRRFARRRIVDAAALDRGKRDGRQERQALHHQHEREQVDLAECLQLVATSRVAPISSRPGSRLPECREIRTAAGRDRPWRCARTAAVLDQAERRPRAPRSIAPPWRRTPRRASAARNARRAAGRAKRNAATVTAKAARIGMVRILSGMAMSTKATTGTQTD